MKKIKIFAIIGVILFLSINLSGCTDNVNELEEKPNDDDLLIWFYNTTAVLIGYTAGILDCLEKDNWYLLEDYAKEEINLIDDSYKPECLAFDLSYSYDRIRDEFYEYLCDESWNCFYVIQATKNTQDGHHISASNNLGNATEYCDKASDHLDICIDLINDL